MNPASFRPVRRMRTDIALRSNPSTPLRARTVPAFHRTRRVQLFIAGGFVAALVALLTEASLMYASFGLNELGPPQMLRVAVALLGR